MATFSFICTPSHHRFSLDIDTGDAGRDEGHEEYKRVRSLIVCSYPGCKARADRGQIENDASAYPASAKPNKLESLRRENRERTQYAMKMAEDEKRRNPERMTELDYIPAGEGGKSRFGGDRIKVPTSVMESLEEKGRKIAESL